MAIVTVTMGETDRVALFLTYDDTIVRGSYTDFDGSTGDIYQVATVGVRRRPDTPTSDAIPYTLIIFSGTEEMATLNASLPAGQMEASRNAPQNPPARRILYPVDFGMHFLPR
jgi:hypothetical protein